MFTRMRLALAIALARVLGTTPLSLHKAAMDHNRTVDAVRGAAEAMRVAQRPLSSSLFASARRLIARTGINRFGMHWGPNGAQAMARRARQIAAGTLTGSNGLIGSRPGGGFVHWNSHGELCKWSS